MLVVPLTSLLQVGALFFFSVLTIDKKKKKKNRLNGRNSVAFLF